VIKVIPIQKVGREKVVREAVTESLSAVPPRRDEATTPSRTPITIDKITEDPRSVSVFTSLPEFIKS
jgi:hypothetical protein